MVRYLTVRDVTDRLYTHAFIEAMRETPVRLEGTAWSVTHQNMDSIKQSLDKLLEQMDLDQDGGEQS